MGNVDIINMSLGAPGAPPQSLHDVIIEATNKGIIIIAAAGNDGKIVNYPARYDEVIAVAALDANGNMAGFSSRDNTVDSVAPGVDIFSTFTNNQYAKMSGTSQAAPFMTGICALLKSFAKSDPSAPKINNYIDMLKAIDIVCDHAEYVSTGKIINGDVANWGFGVPKFCNIDWRTV
jgi:subtilisin family serine protease